VSVRLFSLTGASQLHSGAHLGSIVLAASPAAWLPQKGNPVPKVTFVNEGRTVEVEPGTTVRYAALENDIPLYCMWFGLSKYANCHGNGLCWTDRITVTPVSAITPRTALENIMGATPAPLGARDPRVRLACQVQVFEDCEVTTRCKTAK
jgi:ferredoxin